MATMKEAVQWGINIANNNQYLYSIGAGHGVTFGDYKGKKFDCSSFVSFCLYHGGFYTENQQAFSTGTEITALQNLGFTVAPFSEVGKENLKSGMIIWYSDSPYGHTAIMISNNRLVEAYGNIGIPLNEQIRTADFYGENWQYVAFSNEIDFNVGLWDEKSICSLLGNMWSESTINPQIEENLGAGGVVGFGVGLIQWSNDVSYVNNWNNVLTKALANGYSGSSPKNLTAQLKAIEYELLDGTIKGSGSYYKTKSYPLTGKEFITNSKNKSIEYLTKCYSINRGLFAPRDNNWQGVKKAQELYKLLPNYNKTISEIGYENLVQKDEILGDYYGTNTYLVNDCRYYNCKLIFDYLKSGSDRQVFKSQRRQMVFLNPIIKRLY